MLSKPKAVLYRMLRAGKISEFNIISFTQDQRGYIVFVHSTLIIGLNDWEEIFLFFFHLELLGIKRSIQIIEIVTVLMCTQ